MPVVNGPPVPVPPTAAPAGTRPAFTTSLVSGVSYISAADYKNAPTGVAVNSLVPGGNQAANDAELLNVIRRASAWADEICQQALAATVDIEGGTVRVQRDGTIHVTTRYFPILSVLDFQSGPSGRALAPIDDINRIWFDHAARGFIVDAGASSASWNGPLDFLGRYGYETQLRARWSYVNGYPVTTLTAAATAGSSALAVVSSVGIFAGSAAIDPALTVPQSSVLMIYDGASTEQVSVGAIDTTGLILTTNAPLQYAHAVGTIVTALPASARQAVILLTSALIKTRGDRALVMDSVSGKPRKEQKTEAGGDDDESIARDLLQSYTRMF